MSNMVYSNELFHKAYDSTLEANLSMYDNMPYKRDQELCNHSSIALESGNLIKYYKYQLTDNFIVSESINETKKNHE